MPGPTPPRENLLLNLGCNLVAPLLILSKGTDHLGAMPALLVALAFPLGLLSLHFATALPLGSQRKMLMRDSGPTPDLLPS